MAYPEPKKKKAQPEDKVTVLTECINNKITELCARRDSLRNESRSIEAKAILCDQQIKDFQDILNSANEDEDEEDDD